MQRKKLVAMCFVLLILLVGCAPMGQEPLNMEPVAAPSVGLSSDNSETTVQPSKQDDSVDVFYEEVEYYEYSNYSDIKIDQSIFIVPKSAKNIEDQSSAINVGKEIIDLAHQNKHLMEYVLVGVTHSKQDNRYSFEYYYEDRDISGNVVFVIVDGNSGEFIEAYVR